MRTPPKHNDEHTANGGSRASTVACRMGTRNGNVAAELASTYQHRPAMQFKQNYTDVLTKVVASMV